MSAFRMTEDLLVSLVEVDPQAREQEYFRHLEAEVRLHELMELASQEDEVLRES